MGKSVANVVGIALNGALSIVSFGAKQTPSSGASTFSNLRMGIALDHFDGPALYKVPDVRLWSERGAFLGMATNNPPVDGDTQGDLTVDHNGKEGIPEYALISTEMDAVCISYVSIAGADSSMSFSGDWGRSEYTLR
jgi:hypothetical protein